MNRDLRVLLTMLSAALAVGGCDTLTHKEAKMAAERRWCEMRGRVTLQLARQQFDGMMFREASETATASRNRSVQSQMDALSSDIWELEYELSLQGVWEGFP